MRAVGVVVRSHLNNSLNFSFLTNITLSRQRINYPVVEFTVKVTNNLKKKKSKLTHLSGRI